MIAIDTNILVYAHRAETRQHQRATDELRSLAEGAAPWGLPVFVISEFFRVVTHARALPRPDTRQEALAALQAVLAAPTVRVLSPGDRFWSLLVDVVEDGAVSGNDIFDAQIVAVCREHGVDTILSDDRGLRRFSAITSRAL